MYGSLSLNSIISLFNLEKCLKDFEKKKKNGAVIKLLKVIFQTFQKLLHKKISEYYDF